MTKKKTNIHKRRKSKSLTCLSESERLEIGRIIKTGQNSLFCGQNPLIIGIFYTTSHLWFRSFENGLFYFKFQSWVWSGPDRLACLPFLLAKFTSKFLSFRLFFVWKINLPGFSVLFIQTFCSLCSFDSFLWHSRAAQCIDNFLGLVQRSSMCDAMEIAHFGRLADIQYTLPGAPASFGFFLKISVKLG